MHPIVERPAPRRRRGGHGSLRSGRSAGRRTGRRAPSGSGAQSETRPVAVVPPCPVREDEHRDPGAELGQAIERQRPRLPPQDAISSESGQRSTHSAHLAASLLANQAALPAGTPPSAPSARLRPAAHKAGPIGSAVAHAGRFATPTIVSRKPGSARHEQQAAELAAAASRIRDPSTPNQATISRLLTKIGCTD